MSALDTWMPLYIGDYQRDTSELTLEQSGAYLHLLMRYWVSGALPDDDGRLAAILKVTRTHFARHIGPALRPYFAARDGKLYQGRADAEREKRQKISEKRAENARKFSENSAKNTPNNTQETNDINGPVKAIGAAKREQMPPTSTSTSTNTEKKEREVSLSLQTATPRAAPVGAEFERFWQAYPRKVAKGGARKAWLAAIRKADAETIISAVCAATWRNNEYDPHPATWLNGERWLDAPALTLDQRLARIAGLGQPEDVFAPSFRPETNIVRLRA